MSRKRKIRRSLNVKQVRDFILQCSNTTKFYFGADSISEKKNGQWVAHYAVVLVVHIDGKHGCKIFGEVVTEPDYAKVGKDKKQHQKMRLMFESHKVAELFQKFADLMQNRDFEIHLDYNSNPKFISNDAVAEATGYVLGMCGVKPKIKPHAWAASYAADRVAHNIEVVT